MVSTKPTGTSFKTAHQLFIICACVLLSACASTLPTNTPRTLDADAMKTISSGLSTITERYLEPVQLDSVALDGVRGLATLDPDIQITRSQKGQLITLSMGFFSTPQMFSAPQTQSADAWARFALTLVHAAQNRSSELRNISQERLLEAIFDGMLSGLDPFSRYAGTRQAREDRNFRDGFGGIGIRVHREYSGSPELAIESITPGSPASYSQLRIGDVVLNLNGVPVDGLSRDALQRHLQGPVGSDLTLTIVRAGLTASTPRKIVFNLKRDQIVAETVRAKVKGDILTFRISSFNANTAPRAHDLLQTYYGDIYSGEITGMILDLRGNPGGLLGQSIRVADLFLENGPIISTRGRHPRSIQSYSTATVDFSQGVPLVVLVDGNSASAAEVLASALQDVNRAIVMGATSYGKGTVQTVVRLPNDGELTLTWARLIASSGYALHGLGVLPTICMNDIKVNESSKLLRLTPEKIARQRHVVTAWRHAGLVFDGRRKDLRKTCPAIIYSAQKMTNTSDLWEKMAANLLHNPDLYRQTFRANPPVNTASRQ